MANSSERLQLLKALSPHAFFIKCSMILTESSTPKMIHQHPNMSQNSNTDEGLVLSMINYTSL